MGGEPYTWRRVRTVRRQAVGNLSPKGDKAPTAEPTNTEEHHSAIFFRVTEINSMILYQSLKKPQ